MSQRGHIRTKVRCPNCGGKFADTEKGWECPKCSTTPNRLYIDLSWEGKRIKTFKDTSGLVLDSYDRAARLLTHIRWEIDNHKFDPERYIRTQYEPYFMANFVLKWIKEQEIRHEAKEISFSTLYKYKMIVNKFIINYFGRSDIRTIWTRGVKDFNIHLAELKISPKYREDILGVLRKMFNDALQSEHIDRGQLPVFPTVDVPDPYFDTLTEAQQDEILGKIPENDHPIFHLILWYGLRPSEARAIRRDAIIGDFDKIVIRRTFTRNNRLRENPKENKWRIISLLDETKEILRCLIPSLSGFLFVNQWDRHYSQTYLNDTWNRACSNANFKYIKLYHGSRHSLGTKLANEGYGEHIIATVLGHSDTKTTKKYVRYASDSLKGFYKRRNVRKASVTRLEPGDRTKIKQT